MRNSVLKSLMSVQDMVENRPNSFELYGYDFMIDEDLKTWLIEINSSPSMDYSTVNFLHNCSKSQCLFYTIENN